MLLTFLFSAEVTNYIGTAKIIVPNHRMLFYHLILYEAKLTGIKSSSKVRTKTVIATISICHSCGEIHKGEDEN